MRATVHAPRTERATVMLERDVVVPVICGRRAGLRSTGLGLVLGLEPEREEASAAVLLLFHIGVDPVVNAVDGGAAFEVGVRVLLLPIVPGEDAGQFPVEIAHCCSLDRKSVV